MPSSSPTLNDDQYERLLSFVLDVGTPKADRTGTGTTSLFGAELRYDLSEDFPLITTKRVHFRSVAAELLWFLRGESNVKWLQEQGVTIWDEWADENGDLGPVYGVQWRSWPAGGGPPNHVAEIDQISKVMETLKTDPDSRRMVVSAWNVGELDRMALEPCHMLFQLYVADGRLSCKVTQRSADLFLGVPFNIASYALLTHLFAQQADLAVGELIWSGGDVHIYDNHIEQVIQQLGRPVRPFPKLVVSRASSIFDYDLNDFQLVGYDPHPAIKAPVAV